jgi:hypothetical protein
LNFFSFIQKNHTSIKCGAVRKKTHINTIVKCYENTENLAFLANEYIHGDAAEVSEPKNNEDDERRDRKRRIQLLLKPVYD